MRSCLLVSDFWIPFAFISVAHCILIHTHTVISPCWTEGPGWGGHTAETGWLPVSVGAEKASGWEPSWETTDPWALQHQDWWHLVSDEDWVLPGDHKPPGRRIRRYSGFTGIGDFCYDSCYAWIYCNDTAMTLQWHWNPKLSREGLHFYELKWILIPVFITEPHWPHQLCTVNTAMTVHYAGTNPTNKYYLLLVSQSDDITGIETKSTNMKLNSSGCLCYCLYEYYVKPYPGLLLLEKEQ